MSDCEEKTINYYNSNAIEFQKSISSSDMKETCNRFLSYLSKPAYILDLGCGTGRDSCYFRNCGFSVLPVDASKEMCKIASEVSGVTARLLKFNDLDYIEEFDGIWACASLLHVPSVDIHDVLSKIEIALKKGGYLYCSVKYGQYEGERDGRYFTDYDEKGIKSLFSSIHSLKMIDIWLTDDVRPERNNKWINCILCKDNK